jgi:NAD+ kinase
LGVKRVGFVLKRDKPEAEAIARDLVPWLMERGLGVAFAADQARLAGELPDVEVYEDEQLGKAVDLLIVLGGDGTLLHAASPVGGGRAVHILGINLGTLGFIVPFAPAEARRAVERALAGELVVEERMRLTVRHHRDGVVRERLALNDAVIAQGAMARLVELAASLDGQRIALYRADGLIVCTPTGSTAYNLAAGGPILSPGQTSVAVTPICPHTLTHRPLVVPSTSRISVELPGRAGEVAGIMLTVDGQWATPLVAGDRVEITAAPAPLLIYRSDKPYFEILREKLSWGWRAGESNLC